MARQDEIRFNTHSSESIDERVEPDANVAWPSVTVCQHFTPKIDRRFHSKLQLNP
ncbi:MAG: hypothetical protein IT524_00235 [Nitrosomonas sp.]|uniref:hypothetical protein n=1 Tax=Nitrosomonas sp. JL21 TaxID=153949 RepID=UPI00136CEF12|nr:hypothetical protein [Nitrosomonas sp. JL21]MBL8496409.1 hypothetical protein [Nitrosomonas sp.]MCC7090373.1 hypothetical protein [Nitrosomonas sp.]